MGRRPLRRPFSFMNKQQAHTLAQIVGGDSGQSGGGLWLVLLARPDGALVVFSGDAICEYRSPAAFDQGAATATIRLR